MADRDTFNARIARTQQKAKERRSASIDDVSPATRSTLEWIADIITGVLMFGWLWTLQGLAFAVVAGLAFLRFLGFDVDHLLVGAFALFIIVGLAYYYWENG